MLRRDRGFTLIEIVLVLAIAGLLLLIVFLAVSGAQKSRRDHQRKQDLAIIASLVEKYASNNKGVYPTALQAEDEASQFRVDYGTLNIKDPNTGIHYYIQRTFDTCNGTLNSQTPGGAGWITYAVPGGPGNPYELRMCLEGGGEYWIGN